jgi:hypothetical protein
MNGEKLEICAVLTCDRTRYGRQLWCEKHYSKTLKYGDPLGGKYEHATQRGDFWCKFDRSGGIDACWPWLASKNTDGYGQYRRAGVQVNAHTAVYERLIGPVPAGLELDHTCYNRACVNPAHLEPVTTQENLKRRRPWKRTA